MPANLTPQYKEAEQHYREANGYEEKLAALREMMALLPRHKGTEKLHADLRHRIAKLEEEGRHAHKAGAHRFDPGHVKREGAGQWVLIGPPNAGKSALVRALTHARPDVAPYPFTTRAPQPGMMPFEDVQVQLVDTPAVSVQHAEPYMVNLVHGADGVAFVLAVTDDDFDAGLASCRALIERAHVWPDARPLPSGSPTLHVPRPVVVVLNKCDLDEGGTLTSLTLESAGHDLPHIAVSAERGEGLEELRRAFFTMLRRIRIYAKEPGKPPDLERPFVLRRSATVHELARAVHKDIAERLKFARIWGSAKFDGQQVDRDHVLSDRDVVELHA